MMLKKFYKIKPMKFLNHKKVRQHRVYQNGGLRKSMLRKYGDSMVSMVRELSWVLWIQALKERMKHLRVITVEKTETINILGLTFLVMVMKSLVTVMDMEHMWQEVL